jgi:two-component system sensor histidine kinase HydH
VESILANALGQNAGQLAAAEKRDLLARLLGRLAHEIRNPLSSLDVHVQLLEEDLTGAAPGLREQLAPRLEVIRGELHRLEGIVQHFLRLAGPSALEPEPLSMARVMAHVCELLRPEAGARNIAIQSSTDPALPEILADQVRITQALLNLVINAIQAVERNGTIEVCLTPLAGGISLSVRDTGPGIPAERLPAIFDPYFTTKAEGSGLGLWIAQQIVSAHGGTLRAQNHPAGGAVFTMILPPRPPAVSSRPDGTEAP